MWCKGRTVGQEMEGWTLNASAADCWLCLLGKFLAQSVISFLLQKTRSLILDSRTMISGHSQILGILVTGSQGPQDWDFCLLRMKPQWLKKIC